MEDSDNYAALKKTQLFKPYLQTFIRKQIQTMLEELACETGTESLVILANIQTGSAVSLGSTYSAGFIETTNIKDQFLAYCMNRYHAGDVPIHHTPNSENRRKASPWGPKCKRQQKGTPVMKRVGKVNKKRKANDSISEGNTENHLTSGPAMSIPDTDNSNSSSNVHQLSDVTTDTGITDVNTQCTGNVLGDSIAVKMEPLSDGEISTNQGGDINTTIDSSLTGTDLSNHLDSLHTGINQFNQLTTPTFGPIRFVRKFPPKERTTLTLPEKILIIEDYESGNTQSQRRLAEKYNISKSAVADMLKNRQLLKDHYEFNANTKRKRFNTTSRFAEINEVVWQWFKTARENGIQMSGPMIQEKALHVAQMLQVTDFKGSNGWLHSWRSRYNVTSYRDDSTPSQKQNYINDYSKIEGYTTPNKEMEQSNSIMNYGSLPSSHANKPENKETSPGAPVQTGFNCVQSETVSGTTGTSLELNTVNVKPDYSTSDYVNSSATNHMDSKQENTTHIPSNISKSSVKLETKPLSDDQSEQSHNEQTFYKNSDQNHSQNWGIDNKGNVQSSADSCQSSAYDSIVQNALSELEQHPFTG